MPHKRRICFVTGTRAEFGLMQSVLAAIAAHPRLQLQLVATGMHLDRRHGRTIQQIERPIDAIVPWQTKKGDQLENTRNTGQAIALLADVFAKLKSDIILVVGDRVEAFAAATAAHLSGKIVAHIHGGDRAIGQIDDSLRHAITKLSHLHFPATKQSAARIAKLGEDRWRIFTAGAPGIDGINQLPTPSALPKYRYALIALHPADAEEKLEYRRAKMLLDAVAKIGFESIVIVHPNNDPGSRGIARCWDERSLGERFIVHKSRSRPDFLGLLRDAAVLVGNSSSGIIEAASFRTPVLDIGERQSGRERSGNVANVPYEQAAIRTALNAIWNNGRPKRSTARNVYGGDGAGTQIAKVLSSVRLDDLLRRKLIAY